jgi:hypothetical protein
MIQKATPLVRLPNRPSRRAFGAPRDEVRGRLGAMRGYLGQSSEAGKLGEEPARRGTAGGPSLRRRSPVTISPQ